MKKQQNGFTSRLLLREKTKKIKRKTAFRAKIMLENEAMRKEISTKVWGKKAM